MKVLRPLALLSFVAGVAMLIAGYVFSANSTSTPAPAQDPGNPTAIAATPTPAPSSTPTPKPDDPTPTPTPPPYDGPVMRLKIPRFKVDSLVESIGLAANNQLETPYNPRNTGWYDIYSKPGFGGNAVFSAHVDYFPDIKGPFYQLAKANLDDDIIVQMANGVEYRYQVIRRERFKEDEIPMGDLIWPANRPPDEEWITLITCGGDFVQTESSGAGKYLHRDVVVAHRVQ